MEEIQTFNSSFFLGKSYFSNNRLQNYLILPLFYKTINKLTATQTIEALESNGLSSESILLLLPLIIIFPITLKALEVQKFL